MNKNLSKSQKMAYDTVLKGNNVFVSGGAGTGKSFLLKTIAEVMEKEQHKNVLITSPTGMAATIINGATMHRTFGLSIGPNLYGKPKKKVSKIIKNVDLIIIDEISMCRADMFDTVAFYIKTENIQREKSKKKPIQLVIFGDFFQLPPIIKKEERDIINNFYNSKGLKISDGFAFEGAFWSYFNFKNIILEEVIRQKDPEFIHALNSARIGELNSIEYFNQNSMKDFKQLSNKAIYLAGKKTVVNNYNKTKLEELPSKMKKFVALKTGTVNKGDMIVPETLYLKKGCRVLFSINDENMRYVNGSIGTVKSFKPTSINVELDDGGLVEVHRHEFEIYKYVAREETVKDYENGTKLFEEKPDDEMVRNPKTGKKCTNLQPAKIKRTVVRKEVIGTFEQYPLQLAYAITIHKSQGQTFEEVALDPTSWTNGQLYCALSRVTDINKLYLTEPIKPRFLQASGEVEEFYKNVSTDTKEDYVYVQVPAHLERYIKEIIKGQEQKNKIFQERRK